MQDNENYELDPNFAVVYSFLERFGKCFGEDYAHLNLKDLKDFLEASEVDVNDTFVRLHKKLARGIGEYSKSTEEWYRVIIKFCKDFPDGDNLLIKEKGYTNIPIAAKLRILKNLCEDQFEYNDRFNRLVNEQLEAGINLRHEPVGKDRFGRSYWFILDKSGGLRLFRRWWNGLAEEESWNIVSSDMSELERLIDKLEGDEDMKALDQPLPKSLDISLEEYISSTDLFSTAADDAANMVYFSSKKDYSRNDTPRVKRSKTEIIDEERKYGLPHCHVRLQTLREEQLKRYVKQNSLHETSDDPDSSEIKTEESEVESKPSKEDCENDIEQTNSTSNNSKKSLCNGISSEIKDKSVSDKTNNQSRLKTCNDVREIVMTKSDEIKEENESDLKIIQRKVTEEDMKEDEAGREKKEHVSLANSKGDASSKEGNKANKIEKNETFIKGDTVSHKQEADHDCEKSVFDTAIQDLLLLDGKILKDENLQIKKSLLNGTKKENSVVNEAKVKDKRDKEGLCGVNKDQCTDQKVVDNALKDSRQLEPEKTSCSLSLFNNGVNKTLQKTSEVSETASSVYTNDIARHKGIFSDETFSCKTNSENVSETKGKVKDETLNKENIVIGNDSQDNGKHADHTHTNTLNKVESLKKGGKTDEKKTLSMLVGDELIQIEEASDSGEESQSEQDRSVNSMCSLSKQVKLSQVIEEDLSNLGESGKVLNKVNDKHTGNNSLHNSQMKPDKQPPVTISKIMTENVQASKFGTINTSGLNAAFTSKETNLQKTILVPMPVSNFQTKVSSAANIKTVYVPLVTNCSFPSIMLNTLPCSQTQSLLHQPVLSPARTALPLLRNPGGVRTILQSKLTSSSLPNVCNTAPRIIFAPSLQVPGVITLQKPLSSPSSHIVQGPAINVVTKHVTNCDKTVINTNISPPERNKGNIPKVVGDFEVKQASVSVKDVTIVIGKDGIHYDKSTGKPYKYPNNKKYVVAGPRGKFYDKETGYEVDVPQSENLKHVPGTVYLASGVSFTKEVQEKLLKKKAKESTTKKGKKSKSNRVEVTSSDEEFAKMLESEMEKSSEEESDHGDYDYEKISERVRTAKSKKVLVREHHETMDAKDEEESDSEMVPLVLGRNAKRAAAEKLGNNDTSDMSEGESEDDENSKLCTACSDQDKPSLMLLCDECGNGYHMTCLLPPLLLVPLEDWFCPQCEHLMLIKNLKEKLKTVKKIERTSRNKGSDRISKKAFSIDADNIVELERRSCRQRKDVSYSDAGYDKMFKNVFTEINTIEKKTRSVSTSDSDSEMDIRPTGKKLKTKKRPVDRLSKSGRLKKSMSSGQSIAKKRKLTCLEDESEESGSEYKQTDGSDSSEPDRPVSKSENLPARDELYFTSSGRKIKHISYKIT